MPESFLIGLLSLLGVVIGSLGTIMITWINAHFQNKTAKEKLIYDLAKIYWQEALIQGRDNGGSVYPLESFIISVKYLFELLTSNNLKPEKIEEVLKNHNKLMKSVNKHFDEK